MVERYEPRAIRFMELWDEGGWRMKIYGIAFRRPAPPPELIEAAKGVARARRPQAGAPNEAVGFVGAHHGRRASFVFVDWWANEYELFHTLYTGSLEAPYHLEQVPAGGPTACTWDLRVVSFERQAWLEAMFIAEAGPDPDRYLAARLDETS